MNVCDKVLWAGDINSDFSRGTNHTSQVKEALDELQLISSWNRFDIDFTATFELLGQTFTSTLDHFFWNLGLDNCLEDAGVLHLPDNKSDHSPVYCILNTSALQPDTSVPKKSKPRPSWKRSSLDQKADYRSQLEMQISQLKVPDSVTFCVNVHCKDPVHKEELDRFTIELLETVQEVAEGTLPVPAAGNSAKAKSATPGWRDEVKPYRDTAYFWHQIWKSCGKPINTEVHHIMKRTINTTTTKSVKKLKIRLREASFSVHVLVRVVICSKS